MDEHRSGRGRAGSVLRLFLGGACILAGLLLLTARFNLLTAGSVGLVVLGAMLVLVAYVDEPE